MTPKTSNKKSKIVHGIRGGIPADRMEQIQAALPRSMDLQDLNPCLVDPIAALGSEQTKVRAHVRLSQGWHLLNEVRSALIEAEACKVFYEECEPNTMEAIYWARFYLDDAALRLNSSGEHLLRSMIYYWSLGVDPKARESLLIKVITASGKSHLPQVSEVVATSLRGLTTDWNECKKYRDDWVHNERPGIDGLGWEVSFNRWTMRDIPPEVVRHMEQSGHPIAASGKSVSLGTGRKISELNRIVRGAYSQLFSAYERLAPLLV
jgi:hypothetical protein